METKKAELKVLSKDEQIAVAKDIFKRYPEAYKVAVASDGQAFITDGGEAAAKNHSKNNAYGKELKLETFTRDELEAKVELKKAKEVIALVDAAETVEAVEALVAGDERTTVKEAALKRIETLKAA